MINILTKKFDFEIANLYYKKIPNCNYKVYPTIFIFLLINTISFIAIKNLIKNLISLNFQ